LAAVARRRNSERATATAILVLWRVQKKKVRPTNYLGFFPAPTHYGGGVVKASLYFNSWKQRCKFARTVAVHPRQRFDVLEVLRDLSRVELWIISEIDGSQRHVAVVQLHRTKVITFEKS
jgi:hypothetical protein